MAKDTLMELVNRLSGKVIISSEITDSDVENIDTESLVANIIEKFEKSPGTILGKKELAEVIAGLREKKEPVQIEIIRSADFKPEAKEMESSYRIRNARVDRTSSNVTDFVDYFQDRFRKLKAMVSTYGNGFGGMVNTIESVNQYMTGREISIVGMVYDKLVTRKGDLLVLLEDETGIAKVFFSRPGRVAGDHAGELFDSAMKLVKDDVVAVRGKVSNSKFIIANRLLWPDVPMHMQKKCEEDVAIALVSDTHVGHKLFMEKQFGKFLEWLNGGVEKRKDLAKKIKYVVIAGDLVDGIGVYPEQERELAIDDVYKQYAVFFDFIKNIPDYIEVFLAPGNHDAVQRAEPQPQVGNGFLKDFKQKNVHLITNPSFLTLQGVKLLEYHGTSLDSVIRNVQGCSYAAPAKAMKEILKRRHLSPIYGGNVVVPSKNDSLVIDEVPDILHMGHIHKNGYDVYHGVEIINSGCWQLQTGFQLKQGHIPSPCMLPVYEAKTMKMSLVDFNNL